MKKKNKEPEYYPGSEYKGYIAHSCVPSVWVDRYDSHQSMDCFRLTLETPYPAGITDDELDAHLKEDLSEIFPDIGLIGHNECNRRAFENEDDYYVPFGCRKQVMWSRGTCSVVLLLFDEFQGFPIFEVEAAPAARPDPDEDAIMLMYEDMLS